MIYRPMRWFGRLLPLGFVFVAAAAVVLVLQESHGDGPPLWIGAVWLAAMG